MNSLVAQLITIFYEVNEEELIEVANKLQGKKLDEITRIFMRVNSERYDKVKRKMPEE